MENVIEAAGIKKVYGDRTVLDLERIWVQQGEILVCLGPSGAGKSVLLRILNLLERPTDGRIMIDDREVQDLKGRKRVEVARTMVMLFQDPLLFTGSVARNTAYGLRVRGESRHDTEDRVGKALEMVGLSGFEEKHVSTLSGGEAQRVALARALIIEPRLVFLDEPFANLDRLNRSALQEEVKGILKGNGYSAVFVTHDQEEAARMGDRILIINEGRMVQVGTPEEVFYRPSDEFAARFVGMDNLYRGRVVSSDMGVARVRVEAGSDSFPVLPATRKQRGFLPGILLSFSRRILRRPVRREPSAGQPIEAVTDAAVGEMVTLGLRPDDVILVPEKQISSSASSRNTFLGRVADVEIAGPTARVILECPFKLTAIITRRSLQEMGIAPGALLGARFKATAVNVMREGNGVRESGSGFHG